MSKRVNIMLPEATVKVLDRVAKSERSRSAANLRKRLKEGALANVFLVTTVRFTRSRDGGQRTFCSDGR